MKYEGGEEIVVSRLAELREAMSEIEAPARVKPAVMGAFRARQSRIGRRMVAWTAIAACAAAVLLAAYLTRTEPARVETVRLDLPVRTIPPPAAVDESPSVPVAARNELPPARRAARRRAPKPAPPQREVATEFIALPYAPPLDPSEPAQVVRVRLPRSAMRSVGLPVAEDRWYERVPADVVLGQDGLARAVRFVKFAQ